MVDLLELAVGNVHESDAAAGQWGRPIDRPRGGFTPGGSAAMGGGFTPGGSAATGGGETPGGSAATGGGATPGGSAATGGALMPEGGAVMRACAASAVTCRAC